MVIANQQGGYGYSESLVTVYQQGGVFLPVPALKYQAKNSEMIFNRDTGFIIKLFDELENNIEPEYSFELSELITYATTNGFTFIEIDRDAEVFSIPTNSIEATINLHCVSELVESMANKIHIELNKEQLARIQILQAQVRALGIAYLVDYIGNPEWIGAKSD